MHDKSPTIPHGADERSNLAGQSDHRADESTLARTGSLSDLPKWITPALVQATIRVWQPYYKAVLTVKDAAEILLRVRRLGQLLA